jgi:hypothetical protein
MGARLLAATSTALWLLMSPAMAAAASKPEQAIEKAESQFLATEFDAAIKTLATAISSCTPTSCTKKERARLHLTMGLVLAAGKKQLEDAKDAFIQALDLDPEAAPEAELSTEEVEYAYRKAREQLGLVKAPPPKEAPKPTPEAKPKPQPKEDDDEDDDDDDDEEVFDDVGNPNWVSLSFGWDFTILPSETDICVPVNQNTLHIVCSRADETRYTGQPTLGTGDNINAGPLPSTPRLMAGYDRMIFHNFTVGARVGIAFMGATQGEASFLPVHLEARAGYWFRERPFELAQLRPYVMISGGLAQIDTKLDVQVLEDGAACGASNPGDINSPCTIATSADGRIEPRQQTLSAAKQAGLGFAAGSLGLAYAPIPLMMIGLGFRVSVTFPVVTPVLTPEISVAFGIDDI